MNRAMVEGAGRMGLCAVALALALGFAAVSAVPSAAATASLVADVNSITPPFHANDLGPRQLTPLGQRIVFVESEASSGDELWASDGSDAGTALLHDLCPGSCSSDIRILGTVGSVAFVGVGDAVHGELWRTDGTRGGTFRLGLDFDFQATFAVGARGLFAAVCPTSSTASCGGATARWRGRRRSTTCRGKPSARPAA